MNEYLAGMATALIAIGLGYFWPSPKKKPALENGRTKTFDEVLKDYQDVDLVLHGNFKRDGKSFVEEERLKYICELLIARGYFLENKTRSPLEDVRAQGLEDLLDKPRHLHTDDCQWGCGYRSTEPAPDNGDGGGEKLGHFGGVIGATDVVAR